MVLERLILEYTIGDGYTYSAEVHEACVYHDKQSAIDDFTLLLEQHIIDKNEVDKKRSQLYEEGLTISKKLQKIYESRQKKPKNEKSHPHTVKDSNIKNDSVVQELLLKLQKNRTEQEKFSLDTFDQFVFGGTDLLYSSFIYHSEERNEMRYILPNIYTLDEFFGLAEKNVYNNTKLTTKKFT